MSASLLAGNVFAQKQKAIFTLLGILEGSSMDPDCLIVLFAFFILLRLIIVQFVNFASNRVCVCFFSSVSVCFVFFVAVYFLPVQPVVTFY